MDSQAQQLMHEAYAALDRGQPDRALQIAGELKQMRHSSSFDIQAESLAALGRWDDAIAALEEGVRAAPDVWLLWQSLANLYVQRDRYPEAHAAYGRALVAPKADKSAVHFNRALAYARARNFEEASHVLDLVTDDALRIRARSFKAAALNDLGRHEDAEEVARQTIEEALALPPSAELQEDRARLHGQLARALFALHDRDGAATEAARALDIHKSEPTALFVVRALRDARSAGAFHFQARLRGTWPGGRRFEVACDAVAETAEEILEYCLALEPPGTELEILTSSPMQPRPNVPKGIYGISEIGFK